jgi:hypothetical protein
MDKTHLDLARAVMDARLAYARDRQLAKEATDARRPARRAPRRRPLGWWWDRRLRRAAAAAELPAVETAPATGATAPTPLARAERPHGADRPGRRGETTVQLDTMLDRIAERIVEHGTPTEAPVLEAMSALSRRVCPGAAAALVDWDGSETARLRAYGVVHGVVLQILGTSGQSLLLDEVRGAVDLALAG